MNSKIECNQSTDKSTNSSNLAQLPSNMISIRESVRSLVLSRWAKKSIKSPRKSRCHPHGYTAAGTDHTLLAHFLIASTTIADAFLVIHLHIYWEPSHWTRVDRYSRANTIPGVVRPRCSCHLLDTILPVKKGSARYVFCLVGLTHDPVTRQNGSPAAHATQVPLTQPEPPRAEGH